MSDTELHARVSELDKLVTDPEFAQLEARLNRFNVFDALDVTRSEVKHSRFLGWLLNPNQTHGVGDVFLKAVLMDVLRDRSRIGFSAAEIDCADLFDAEVHLEHLCKGSASGRIDVIIKCPGERLVVVIEHKIDSSEHSDQLSRYALAVGAEFDGLRHLFIYLTLDGDEPAKPGPWITYSYEQLRDVVSLTRERIAPSMSDDLRVFISHYQSLLELHMTQSGELRNLCRRLYAKHEKAIDLINEYAGVSGDIVNELEERVKSQWPDALCVTNGPRELVVTPGAWLKVLPPIRAKDEIGKGRGWLAAFVHFNDSFVSVSVRCRGVDDLEQRNQIIAPLIAQNNPWGFRPSFKSEWRNQRSIRLMEHQRFRRADDKRSDSALVNDCFQSLTSLFSQLHTLPEAIAARR